MTTDRWRLAKVLTLLASPVDGEALAAEHPTVRRPIGVGLLFPAGCQRRKARAMSELNVKLLPMLTCPTE